MEIEKIANKARIILKHTNKSNYTEHIETIHTQIIQYAINGGNKNQIINKFTPQLGIGFAYVLSLN